MRTLRLTLTIWDAQSTSDVDFCLALFNDPEITAKAGRIGIDTPEKLAAFRISTSPIPKYTPLKLPISGPAVYLVRHGTNDPSATPIGLINVCNRGEDFPPDMGWATLPKYQQRGFAAEAAERVFNYFMNEFQGGFRHADPPIGITAVLNLENKAPMGVARRLGLVDLGDVRPDGLPDGKYPVYGTPNLLIDGEKPFTKEKNAFYAFGSGEAGKRTTELIFGKKEVPAEAEEAMAAVGAS